MAKDKRIGEISGISAAAVVGLNRVGIVSVHDLLAADFDRVAYIVDDYNEAARLVREARKLAHGEAAPSKRGAKHAPESLVPAPLTSVAAPSPMNRTTRSSMSAPSPSPHGPEATISAALSLAAKGLTLSGSAAAGGRAVLGRRLNVAGLLLEHGAGEAEVAAGLLLDPAESGAVSGEEISSRLGAAVEHLLEECAGLRAVPMLPTGKLPRYYLEMAKAASRESRRVCAAHLLVSRSDGRGAQLLAEALSAGGPDELVAEARAAVDEGARAAA